MSNEQTILSAKHEFFESAFEKGRMTECPCCGRWTKAYKRPFNITMLKGLHWLALANAENPWVDVPNKAPRWLIRSNQLSTCRWWHLVERMEYVDGDDSDTKHSGLWRITDMGKDFLSGKEQIKKYCITFDGNIIGYDGPYIGPNDVDEFFSYSKTMESFS
jgi:hypothetical protein